MTPAPLRQVAKTVGLRVSGEQPGAVRAIVTSAIVGFATAGVTYRLLRRG